MRGLSKILTLVGLMAVAGCSSSDSGEVDAGLDGDGEVFDAGLDGGDQGVDSGDEGPDEDLPDGDGELDGEDGDAGFDGGDPNGDPGAPDGGDQQADDAGGDGDGGDSGPDWLWPWCPDESDYLGQDWDGVSRADELALYCVINQGYTVEEAYQNKARLRIVPGVYPVPDSAGEYELLIPACIEIANGVGSELVGAGDLSVTSRPLGQGTQFEYHLSQPVAVGGQLWSLGMSFHLYVSAGPHPEIIFSNYLNRYENGNEVFVGFRLDNGAGGNPWWVLPCEPLNYGRKQDRAIFDRGEITVIHDVHWDVGSAGGAPAVFQQGYGELDGIAFDQEDYFKLAHIFAHHNWGGTFLLVFDQPIGSACAIKIQIPSQDGGGPDLGGWTLDCNLDPIDELSGFTHMP